ncbi:MAG: asparagine synthase (glutamine-hydrolyzing) [Crocinitomicaceae bacterium]
MSHAFLNSIIFTTKVNTLCGIVGIWLKNESEIVRKEQLEAAVFAVHHRGPDSHNVKIDANKGFGHSRLSILDLSTQANQPMMDSSKRYTLVFNGEIYNHEELRKKLPTSLEFKTSSDTEVLLQYLIHFGLSKINDLNGFFSFLFYDSLENKLLFARDRYGIKPLFLYEDANQVIFASELASIFQFDIDKNLNSEAINLLFQLTYIPAPLTILNNCKQIMPGQCGIIENGEVQLETYYELAASKMSDLSYADATKILKIKIENAVKKRLISDVPLGTFLSGGVDSSIVSLIASQNKKGLKTFSIGFDVLYFDESKFATEMAKSISSDHHQIQLTRQDFKQRFASFLDLNHQPFADSSAFAIYLLSEKTKNYVTVSLSGDGADELFGGYRKHEAEFKIRGFSPLRSKLTKWISKMTVTLPQGRHGKWTELNRKIQKLSRGLTLSANERYWEWLKFISNKETKALLRHEYNQTVPHFRVEDNLNQVLVNDQSFVLPNDMLVKVDRMSMAHGLEVRTPFLDHELVDFVNTLPASFKVNKNGRKQILIDAFKDQLPERIYKREKKGFEIPLFNWLKDEISETFESVIFSKPYIEEQGLFKYNYIQTLKNEFGSPTFSDKIYLVWTLIIFQNWWNKNIWKQNDQ